MPTMYARIWVSVPDPIDGYYVELLDTVGKKKVIVQLDSIWCATVEECKEWAISKGATRIEEFQSANH